MSEAEWRRRRALLETLDLTSALPSSRGGDAPLDRRVHEATHRAHQLENSGKVLPPSLLLLLQTSLSLESDFISLRTLSSAAGPFASVTLQRTAPHLTRRPKLCVVKTLERSWAFRMKKQQSPQEELKILRLSLTSEKHKPPIPKLIASTLTASHFHIVISHAARGDLWSMLEQTGDAGLGEDSGWLKRWMAELVEAVDWLHTTGWAHRDLKPHNLLLTSAGQLLLTDFGSAAPLTQPALSSIPRRFAQTLVGTPDYIAPEILLDAEKVAKECCEDSLDDDPQRPPGWDDERAYGKEVDWWSFGVVLYELLYNKAPFFAESISGTYERIVNSADYLTFPQTPRVSSTAQDLIRRLLATDDARLTADKVKKHSWFAVTSWGRLDNASRPTHPLPPPPAPPPSSPSGPNNRTQDPSSTKLFDFSAFFSSPGLSILRPSPATGEAARLEEIKYWDNMTTVPARDAFEEDCEDTTAYPTAPKGQASATVDTRQPYETPLFLRTHSSQSRAGPGAAVRNIETGVPQMHSSRSRRVVSEVEAWKEMQEHAWEVATTSKKHTGRAGVLEALQRRQRGVMKSLESIEKDYQPLFELAEKESGSSRA